MVSKSFRFIVNYATEACRSKLQKSFNRLWISTKCYGKFLITHIEKNLTQVNEWFHSVLPYVLPRTSVGHDSSRDVNPLRKIWWRNNTVSELRKMELTSSWREKEDSELNNQFTLVGSSCCYLVRAGRTFWRRCHFERSKEARNQYLKSCRKLI